MVCAEGIGMVVRCAEGRWGGIEEALRDVVVWL